MPILYSSQHREIVGSVNDAPYQVSFDADGFAEVDQAVADQLTSSENFGCVLVDEDGAIITPDSTLSASTDPVDTNVDPDPVVAPEMTEEVKTDVVVPEVTTKKGKKEQGSDS